ILVSFVLSILFIILSKPISTLIFDQSSYYKLIIIISLQIPFANLNTIGLILLRFQKLNFKFLTVVVINLLFSFLFVYLFVIYYDMGMSGVFLAQLSAVIIS